MAFRRAISHRPRNFFKIPLLSSFFLPLRASAPLRLSARSHFLPFAGIRVHSRAPSPLRISLCTAEDCHNHNKFSPRLRASVRAPSLFLPFAGPKPQKNLTPAIEQIPPTTVGGTPTLLEPPSAPLRVASLLRYAPVAPPGLHICLSLWTCAIARVFASFAGTYFPYGAALRAVCAASRRSNFVLFPHPCFRNPLRGLLGGEGGIDSGLRPSPLRGCASRSLCRFAALELRSHPTHMF
jgi:hypothetical protein